MNQPTIRAAACILWTAFLSCFAGCAADSGSAGKSQKPVAMAPVHMHIGGNLSVDVPPDVAGPLKLPITQLRARYSIDASSDPVATDLARSHYRGTLRISITDLKGERTYVDLNTTVEGEANGTPDEAIWSIFGRLSRSGELVGSALEKTAATQPANRAVKSTGQ
jgi:hypothetical protein